MTAPGPVQLRRTILGRYMHAWTGYLRRVPPPTSAQLDAAARRWAAEDRVRGYRILPPV